DVGKRANEIGPLRVFRELINEADENLLAAGNYTQCPTIEVLKKAASDYREKMHIDENIFQECRMIRRAYLKDDTSSTYTKGYIHEMGEVPFRTHLYSETQIERYINYVKNEKYSYVHIDATGAVLKQMCEQKQPLLYAMIFKDGTDANDTVPLAHSVLTDHTVPSLGYFFGKVAYNITEVAGKLVLPSFFIIDFSAATMNAVLQAFNIESINAHLNRCWNVVQGKYSSQELRSLSFIHLCCCHVIHAMARSLTTARTDKKIRRALLHILAFMLCSNDIEQLYDTLGQMINIFGDPNEKNAREKLEQMVSLDLNVDEESASMLKNGKPTVDDDEESEASIESDLDTNTVASNTNIASPVNYEQKRTTDQSSNKPHAQFSSQPEVIINGCTIRWPKFEVNNVTFEGRLYSLRLTCPLDAPLLALYFLYKTDNKVASEFDDAPASSPYSTLVKTFQLVEKDGWDTARIYWLLAFNILKQTDCKPKNLFGSLDERVFSFLKRQQQYSTTVTCSRLDCTDKERILSTTELGIRSCDVYIENFEEEVISVCQAMMKGQHEMTEADALKNKYKYGSVPMINCETNESGYIKGWLCDAFNVQEPATFDHGYPPIIIANIPPVIRNTIEGYDIYPGRFRNMKRVIRIGH
ncbi:unnamed protein product, partial [Rotaria socialis]